jgi:hypothetical protein
MVVAFDCKRMSDKAPRPKILDFFIKAMNLDRHS